MRFAIEGLIESVGAADIFLFLGQTRRTSMVAFERPDQETRVFFVDGQPVWSVSSKGQLQIESRLSMGGVLKLRDIETALLRQKAGPNRVPQTLIAELMATEASMESDLMSLAIDALRDVATWTQGSFTVYDGVIPPPWAHLVSPDFPTLLVEALRGQCDKETLQREFVSRKGLLKARPAPRNVSVLNEAERTVLALVNEERTIEEILKRCGLDEFQALSAMHVLCALHTADLLPPMRTSRPAAERPAAPAPPAPPPPPPSAPPRPAPSADADVTPRTGTGTESAPAPEAPRPAAPAEAKPKGPPGSAESTAKLHALPEMPAPEPVRRVLRVVGDDKTKEVPLIAPSFAIGRHPRNDLVLKDPRISSFHCRIELEGDKYMILDLKSRNGTMLNSSRIDRAPLKANDIIQLGSTKISYFEN